jgi:hypothetical protein
MTACALRLERTAAAQQSALALPAQSWAVLPRSSEVGSPDSHLDSGPCSAHRWGHLAPGRYPSGAAGLPLLLPVVPVIGQTGPRPSTFGTDVLRGLPLNER